MFLMFGFCSAVQTGSSKVLTLKGLKTFRQWDIDTRPETRSVSSTKQRRISNIFASIGYTLTMVIADHFVTATPQTCPFQLTPTLPSNLPSLIGHPIMRGALPQPPLATPNNKVHSIKVAGLTARRG